jgi:hypothetical protein
MQMNEVHQRASGGVQRAVVKVTSMISEPPVIRPEMPAIP